MSLMEIPGLIAALAIGGVIAVKVLAEIVPQINGLTGTANTTVTNMFEQTFTAFGLWPIVLLVVIATVVIKMVRF